MYNTYRGDKMLLKEFSNDAYQLLAYLKSIEVEYKKDKIIIDTQQEIGDALHFSKGKVNQLMAELIQLNVIEKQTKRGKYKITVLGNNVIKLMEVKVDE